MTLADGDHVDVARLNKRRVPGGDLGTVRADGSGGLVVHWDTGEVDPVSPDGRGEAGGVPFCVRRRRPGLVNTGQTCEGRPVLVEVVWRD